MFFLLLGVVTLLARQGFITPALARELWQLWPLILVGIGVGLVLRRTTFEALGGVIVAATFGLLLGAGLGTGVWGFGGFGGCTGSGGQGLPFPAMTGTLGGESQLTIDVDCGALTLAPASGSGYRIEGEDADGRGPIVDATGATLRIASRDGGQLFRSGRDHWRMSLGTDPTLRLDVQANAGSLDLDLAAMHVPELVVSVNAGEAKIDMRTVARASTLTASTNAGTIRIDLPVEDMRGSLAANAGTIALCAPPGVALRFRVHDNITARYDFIRGGLLHRGDAWESPDYAAAEVRLEFDASANAGTIRIDPAGTCGD